ncbi:MAG: dUTP diphosphatase [Erysipelotrichaceae bacterium]|nr:dUTP diphosphatase [Erysipelotrichaceae bacterium]
MNDVAKLYQVYINREVATTKNEVLNIHRLNQKVLAFLHDLSEVSQESRIYLFWENKEPVNHDKLLEVYLSGLTMLMSIGYELRIDTIKEYREIPEKIDLISLFYKIYQSIIEVGQSYSSEIYQNTINDYFTLGFRLGIHTGEIIDNYEK